MRSLRRYFNVSLSSLKEGGTDLFEGRKTCERRERGVKVIFFQPPTPTQKKCIFLEGMKILDFSFVLLVLTNKNLSLKNCGVYFIFSDPWTVALLPLTISQLLVITYTFLNRASSEKLVCFCLFEHQLNECMLCHTAKFILSSCALLYKVNNKSVF